MFVNIREIEKSIDDRHKALLSDIESERRQLLMELNKMKEDRLKVIQTKRNDVERQMVIFESFKRYYEELMKKGSECDISRSADDLIKRSQQLIKSHQEFNSTKMRRGDRITFTPANISNITSEKLIGQLNFKLFTGMFITI